MLIKPPWRCTRRDERCFASFSRDSLAVTIHLLTYPNRTHFLSSALMPRGGSRYTSNRLKCCYLETSCWAACAELIWYTECYVGCGKPLHTSCLVSGAGGWGWRGRRVSLKMRLLDSPPCLSWRIVPPGGFTVRSAPGRERESRARFQDDCRQIRDLHLQCAALQIHCGNRDFKCVNFAIKSNHWHWKKKENNPQFTLRMVMLASRKKSSF